MLNILSVIVLLGILIFVHELGHFLVAKYAGVGVMKFSLGFGPRLIGKKIGETEYLISLVPLGGYVKLLGESEEDILSDDDKKRSFIGQSVWKRMGIVVTGPAFNFIFAIVIFTFVNVWGVPALISKIGAVQEGSSAYKAALQKGDVLTAIDGKQVRLWKDMAEIIKNSNGRILSITIKRNGELQNALVKPELFKVKNIFGEEDNSYKIGVSPSMETIIERLDPFSALREGIDQAWVISKLTVMSIIKMFQGTISPKNLGGPIMIAQLASAQLKEGIIPYILFMAILSINLAVLNLLPIPVLDGGHLLFYLVEAVTGREINIKWRERAQQAGFVLLILLMIFVLWMDLERLNLKFIHDFGKVFNG